MPSKVISILDGDTIEVLHNNRAERIRLSGIDCPEKGLAYGQKAKHAASALVFGKEVTLQTYGTDKYGRTLADMLLPDPTDDLCRPSVQGAADRLTKTFLNVAST